MKNLHRNKALAFEEIEIGTKASFKVKITEELHADFAKLSGDYSPIHSDEKFCADTKFKKRIGYAFMLTSFLSRLYGEHLPGGSSICIKQDSKFIKPFFIGDEIAVIGEVTGKTESTGFVEIKTKMIRNDSETVFKGKGLVQVAFEKKKETPLYEFENEKITRSDFVKAFKDLGIKEGDELFVHSDVAVYGQLATFDRSLLLNSLVEALKEGVGQTGTLVFPSFSYSFCKGKIFDVQKTKSTVGVLSEFFRKLPETSRTKHPIFSCSVTGKNSESYLNVGKDSFDEESIFGRLHKNKGKLLFLGAPFQSCTYIHYVEQMHGIPYRFLKTFSGEIKDQDESWPDECTFFVRYLDKNVVLKTDRLERYLLENGYMKEARLGNGRLLLIDADTLFKEGCKLLDEDIYYFLAEKPE